MKKLTCLLTLVILLANATAVLAYQYSEAEKQTIYDAYERAFFYDIRAALQKRTDLTAASKNRIMSKIKASYSRENLINSTWSCLQKYPPNEISDGFLTCGRNWTGRMQKVTLDALYAESNR